MKPSNLIARKKGKMTFQMSHDHLSITTLSFRANGPAPGTPYSHVHVEATARVDPGQSPDDVMDGLRSYVLAQLVLSQQERKSITEAVTLDAKIAREEHELERLRRMRDEIRS